MLTKQQELCRIGGLLSSVNGDKVSLYDLTEQVFEVGSSLVDSNDSSVNPSVLFGTFEFLKPNDIKLFSAKKRTIQSFIDVGIDAPLETHQKIEAGLSVEWKNPNFEKYKKSYEWAQEKFKSKELEKAVLTQNFEGTTERSFKETVLHFIRQLNCKSSTAYGWSYGFWDLDKKEAFFGLSPERLLWSEDLKTYKTESIAGTKPVGLREELLTDQKLIKEQKLVTEDIIHTLKSLGIDSEVDKQEIIDSGLVSHLRHEIRMKSDQVENKNQINLIQGLHPTPALGLKPRVDKWLPRLGSEMRKEYGGGVFAVCNEEFLSVVCIRGIWLKENKINLWVGGGVLPESILHDEIEELELKFKSVCKLLSI